MASSQSSGFDWLGVGRRMKSPAVKLVISCVLLVVIYSLEKPITELFALAVGESVAFVLYVVLLVPPEILASYCVYQLYVAFSTPVIQFSLAKLKVRSATSTILLLNKILGLLLLVTTAISLLSTKFPFLYVYAQGVIASFSGLFSLLVTLIVAMQMKEIGGNFLAGLMIKSTDVIGEQDYIKLESGIEYVRIEKIDHTYTRVVNILNEETFIPNLKFLTENFRKPFSKDNREYVDLRFSLSYKYSPKQVEQDVTDLVAQYNGQSENRTVKIDAFLVVTIDLGDYSVVYELRVKPSTPVFPEAIRSDFRRLLHEKYGEDLATPILLNLQT